MNTFSLRMISFLYLMITPILLHAQTILPGGYVSGTWNANGSPYIVNDDVLVHPDSTLVVDAGTTVLFTGQYFLEVQGQLLVSGTASDSVTFDRENDTITWRGIFFNYTDTSMMDSSILSHGSISHTSGGSCLTIHHSSRLRVSDFTISHGASFRGGGINCRFSNPCLENLMVQYNLALDGPGIALEESNASLKNCTIWSNHADGAGGGMVIFAGSAPILENCVINFNSSFGSGGGVYINDAFPVFKNCEISHNIGAIGGGTTYSGGGISVKLDSGPYFENCIIQENTSESFGGGIAIFSPSQFINCLFAHNHATTNGGAVYLGSGNVIESPLYNCTLADNLSPHGSAMTCYNHVAIVRNCIFWDQWNLSPNSLIYLGSITALDVADIAYSDIQNGRTSIELWQNASYNWGQNNIDTDPQFDTLGFGLSWNSPCIEAGTPDTTGLGLPETDLDGQPRIVNTKVDMGAYEYQLPVGNPESGIRNPDFFRMYPVPAGDFVNVEVPENNADGILQVINTSGIVVIEEEMTSHFIKINIEDFPPGLYLVRIINDEGITVQKFLIY